MKTQTTFVVGVIALLAACGGGSSGSTGGIPSFSSALAVTTEGQAALDRVSPLGLTAPADFQRSGSADFSGTIVINDNDGDLINDASVVGGMTMNIDFANEDNVTGTAGNFFDLASTPVDGTLELSDAEFSEGTEGGGLVADLTGQLSNVGRPGQNDTYDYELEMGAIYYGDGVEALVVIMGGTVSETGSATTNEATGAATLER